VLDFCTYHEYRYSYGLIALLGIMTGLTDGLVDDFTIKAFIWLGLAVMYCLIVSYEFIVMETPPHPKLQAMMFVLTAPCGLLPAHHFTWLVCAVMRGLKIDFRLWLAPNIYADLNTYNAIMVVNLVCYLAMLALFSIRSCD